jgi:hypothetical protein
MDYTLKDHLKNCIELENLNLESQQKSFLLMTERELKTSSTFERNAIPYLLTMLEIKTRIKQLQDILDLLNMMDDSRN